MSSQGLEGPAAWSHVPFAQSHRPLLLARRYMAIKGLHTPQNFTRAREHFEDAAARDLPSALNGLGAHPAAACSAAFCAAAAHVEWLVSLVWIANGARRSPWYFCLIQSLPLLHPILPAGVLHFHGQGTAVNYTAARLYFEQAADRDHDAAYNLATVYQVGAHCPGPAWCEASRPKHALLLLVLLPLLLLYVTDHFFLSHQPTCRGVTAWSPTSPMPSSCSTMQPTWARGGRRTS